MDGGQREKGKKPVFTIERGNPPGSQGWPPGMRPLSDIRELTEPSLVDALEKRPSASVHRQPSVTRQSSLRRGPSLKRAGSVRIVEPIGSSSSSYREDMMVSESTIDSPESLRDGSSLYSIPISTVPTRQSSNIRDRPRNHRSTASRSSPTPLQRNASRTIPYRGTSHSPVKQVRARLDAVGSDTSRRVPSGTFIRNPVPRDILEFPTHRHPRIGVDLQIGAPLFVGGGTVEGYVRVVVDEADKTRNKKSLTLGRIAVDLVGTEETSSNRKAIFLSLGTELIDSTHPPPRNMVEPQDFPDDDCFWSLIPSFTSLPFVISLPLDTGPPPFHSKHARIRFVLCATILIKDGGRQYLVRCSEDIAVLPTYDPEKALRSLPSSLTASDEQSFSRSGLLETAKITAGLHRQVWVSGSSIFVDIHIANGSRRTIKKLELSLERDILCYRHAAAATLEQSASQARIFESNERSILSKHTMKQGANGWTGVEAYGSITRTCDLDIPRGHATVKCGMFRATWFGSCTNVEAGNYFEVRYFLNITIGGSRTSFNRKMLSVQLPIIVIHMNSLDVLPNSVAQVAAAIEEKRSHHRSHRQTASQASVQVAQPFASPARAVATVQTKSSRLQGRAFAAPRQQSLDRMRASAADLRQLQEELESSPRKHQVPKRLVESKQPQRSKSLGKENSRTGNTRIVSRPAREVHKQPSNLAVGGISVGSYTIFNHHDHDSPSGSSSNNGLMEYITPPSKRKEKFFSSPLKGEGKGVGSALKHVRSVDSFRSHKPVTNRWRDHFGKDKEGPPPLPPPPPPSGPIIETKARVQQQHASAPYMLGLVNQAPLRPNRSSLDQEIREQRDEHIRLPDKSRFEFRAVTRKASGLGLKGWLGERLGRSNH